MMREKKKCTAAATAVAAMKEWLGIKKRAQEMALTLPDPSVRTVEVHCANS